MKLSSPLAALYLASALALVIYAGLFQVMAHTRLIEKVMSLDVSPAELLLIAIFLFTRLVTYLFIPSLGLATIAYALVMKLPRKT